MLTGILAGVTWALETVILGIALQMSPLTSDTRIAFLAPFIATFLHDAFSAIYMLFYHVVRGKIKDLLAICKKKTVLWLILSSTIGGPIGMTGYVMAVRYMGPSVGAVASAIYPAVGAVLACLFLKEKNKWYQWIFLAMTLLGVLGISYSPGLQIENVWLGLLGAFMCAFGWGIEAVILAKCFKDGEIKSEYDLNIRQAVSALIYGSLILPTLGAWDVTLGLFTGGEGVLLLIIAIAALCATLSYMFYYRSISKIGAAKAMALNITYTAWAILFTVILPGDLSVLNPMTLTFAPMIVVCGFFAATDIKQIFQIKKRDNKE